MQRRNLLKVPVIGAFTLVLVSRTKKNRIGFTILLLPVVSRSVSQH